MESDCPVGLSEGASRSPDVLVERMEELEAEAVLLRWSLDQLTDVEEDRPDPVGLLE